MRLAAAVIFSAASLIVPFTPCSSPSLAQQQDPTCQSMIRDAH